MPDAPQAPVFIDQTPDYQQMVKKTIELAAYKEPITKVAHDLGLDNELAVTRAALTATQDKAQVFEANGKILQMHDELIHRQAKRTSKDLAISGDMALIAGSLGAGLLGHSVPKGQRFTLGNIAKVVSIPVAIVLGWVGISNKVLSGGAEEMVANRKAAVMNSLQEDQVMANGLAIQDAFIAKVATRALEQQKMLEGDGPDMKLVSTAQVQAAPETAPAAVSMVEKYAAAPVVSKAAAIVDEKTAAASMQIAR